MCFDKTVFTLNGIAVLFMFPKVDFAIKRLSDASVIKYSPACVSKFFPIRGLDKRTWRVGYFEVPEYGEYLIAHQIKVESFKRGDSFKNEVIIIRKYISVAKQVLATLGVAVGTFIFVMGMRLWVLEIFGVDSIRAIFLL